MSSATNAYRRAGRVPAHWLSDRGCARARQVQELRQHRLGHELNNVKSEGPQFSRFKAAIAATGAGRAAETLTLAPPNETQSDPSSYTRSRRLPSLLTCLGWCATVSSRLTFRNLTLTLVVALISIVYGTSGIIVWSAYGRFPPQSKRDVRKIITAPDTQLKLTPTNEEPRQVAALPTPGSDQSMQGAGASRQAELASDASRIAAPIDLTTEGPLRPALGIPDGAVSEQAREEADLEVSIDRLAKSTLGQPTDPPKLPPAVTVSQTSSAALAEPATSMPASSASAGMTSEPVVSAPPEPSLKPLDVIAALASADPTTSRMASVKPKASARTDPPIPTLKPAADPATVGSVELATPPPRGETLAGSFQAFWSGLRRLFAATSPPVLLAANDNGSDHRSGDDFAQTGETNGFGGVGTPSSDSTPSGASASGALGGSASSATSNAGSSAGGSGASGSASGSSAGANGGRGGNGGTAAGGHGNGRGGRGGSDDGGGGRGGGKGHR
jgi:hypothetical protein